MMSRKSTIFRALALGAGVLSLSGCNMLPSTQKVVAVPTPVPTPAGPQPPAIDFDKIRPNELGVIPVIMYHEVKGTKDTDLIRSIAGFKKDLEVLHKAGFYPVNLGDVVNHDIDVPAGKSPVVLTFDDARGSQFQLIEQADSMKVDPNSAVGIMEDFYKKHPQEWALRGTFFVLPKSKSTLEPFGQVNLGTQKMEYLVKQGFELGNHSTHHRSFRGYTPAQIQEELGFAHNAITEAVPTAKIRVVAMPMGVFPRDKKNWPYLLKGQFQGKSYEYQAAFLAAWRPMPSPASKEYDPLRLERINSINGTNGIRDWVEKLTGGAAVMPRFVSDGDSSVISYPKSLAAQANVKKIEAAGKLAYAYETKGGGAKPIVGVVDPDEDTEVVEEPSRPRVTDTTPPGNNYGPPTQTATGQSGVVVSEGPGG